MKSFSKSFITILTALLILSSCAPNTPSTNLAEVGIIPKVVSVTAAGESFKLTNDVAIQVATEDLMPLGKYLADRLQPATGFELKLSTKKEGTSNTIRLSIVSDEQLGDEGYELAIARDVITISANKPAGLFYGIQTLRQLLPPAIEASTKQEGPWHIATGTIRDFPTYAWRGAMLDVARHFFKVEDVKRYIDLISYYKMNILHLHLSDDQGWRIEIKSWPKLATIGGSTEVGGGEGGYYTQEQYSEIVAYAESRFITIVPEIDLPGHINSALASYGELNGGTIVPEEGRKKSPLTSSPILGGEPTPTDLYTGTEVGWSTLRVEKEITFKFIDDVLRELAAITPGPYIHIGGDEAAATKKEDYLVFINRFTEMVRSHGKIMIGWEEIAQGNIDNNVIIQHWHSQKYAQEAVEKNARLIMSPANRAYLDMKYDSTTVLGLKWAGYIEVDHGYNWNPATEVEGITNENILGVESPLWSETVTNMDEIEFLAFPRLPGYAEIGWSAPEIRNWDEYKVRLGKHGKYMKAREIDFYKSKLVPWAE